MSVVVRGKRPADVTLLLEGTYPYVRGGVSGWVHQMINGLPEFTFSLVFIGGEPESYDGMRYELPDNVVHLETHYLSDARRSGLLPEARKGNSGAFRVMDRMHRAFREPGGPDRALLLKALGAIGRAGGISHADFLYSEEAWRFVCDYYREHCADPSFVDYFWTVRTMHAPVFMLEKIERGMPESRFFHAVSTGYGGFLGALASLRRGRSYLISEHGIYTKERKIDLAQAEWIRDHQDAFAGGIGSDLSYLRRMWSMFFEGLGRIAYESATRIVSLYEGNRQRQIRDGADPDRTMVVPNGIRVERFVSARRAGRDRPPHVAALIGRVVPIKDIKTFIRAMRLVCARIPDAEGWIVGPDEEDPAYAEECRSLAAGMGLDHRVRFLGMRRVEELLPEIGVNVLTSISEALPLVLLEGFAGGVPAVASDVGACRELIYGASEEDRELGAAGVVTPIASPDETADGIMALMLDEERWRAARQTAVRRVERFYTEEMLFDAYRSLYNEMMRGNGKSPAKGGRRWRE